MSQGLDGELTAPRILVIDDDGDFRRSMKLMVEPTGIATLAVRDICSLLTLRPCPNDIVFIDLVMPGIDGIQVLGELARSQVQSKIVLMSGRSADVLETAASIGRGLGLWMGGVLKKPFRLAQLHTLVAETTSVGKQYRPDPLPHLPAAADLLSGMNRGELQVALQPIIEIASGEPWAFEALARWHSGKHGLVHPARFLPLAAEAGLMPALSEVVVRLAAEQSAIFKASGYASKVCVNFDGADLSEASLPETLLKIVQEFGVPPSALVIELTESRAAENQLSMVETLARLRLQGFALALDDFGTAYSSLDRIRNLPFSILKIDRSFVSDVESNVRARGIVSACISLARRCKLLTVAEGVETAGQMQALKRMGCDMVQGYFIAKPMLPVDLLNWLNGRSVPRTSETAASRRKIAAGGA